MTQLSPSVTPSRPDDEEEQSVTRPSGGFAGPVESAQRPPEFNLPEPEEPEDEETPAVGGDTEDIPGLEDLEPEFARRIASLIRQSGGQITITSGYRSEAEQARLYQNALAKYGSPQAAGKWVAPPGKSNHGKGVAVDLGGNLDLAHKLAPGLGLHFPMGHEPWHVEPAGVRTDPATPREAYTDPTTKDRKPDQPEVMASIADAILTDASTRLANPGQSFAGPVLAAQRPPEFNLPDEEEEEAGVEAPEGDGPEAWIRQAMKIEGVGEDWYPGLYKRMMQESGGRNIPQGIVDINTQKGTPAFGPMQVIEPTFRANMRPGYETWKDPLHNTIAAVRYIRSRYGHPDKLPKGGY